LGGSLADPHGVGGGASTSETLLKTLNGTLKTCRKGKSQGKGKGEYDGIRIMPFG